MSLVAFVMIVSYAAMFGIARAGDEGAPARIFQLVLVVQALMAVHFLVKWVPRAPKQGLQVLALQIGAALLPISTVVYLERGLY
jgi:hypothetical protein